MCFFNESTRDHPESKFEKDFIRMYRHQISILQTVFLSLRCVPASFRKLSPKFPLSQSIKCSLSSVIFFLFILHFLPSSRPRLLHSLASLPLTFTSLLLKSCSCLIGPRPFCSFKVKVKVNCRVTSGSSEVGFIFLKVSQNSPSVSYLEAKKKKKQFWIEYFSLFCFNL